MKKKDTSKPLMLYLPESIYLQLIKIKELEPDITNVELIERFLATKEFDEIKKGNFHDNLFSKINFAEAFSPTTSKPRRDLVSVIVANVFCQSTSEDLSVLARKRRLADQLYS